MPDFDFIEHPLFTYVTLAALGLMVLVAFHKISNDRRKTRPKNLDLKHDLDWIEIGAFPLDFQNLQPFGVQFVGPHYGHNAAFLTYQKLKDFLESSAIPFRIDTVQNSLFSANKVSVPKEFVGEVRAFLDQDPGAGS